MTIYLVRHAHAGSRSGWKGRDADRPLSARGEQQAVDLAERLADLGVARIYSSPAVRCVQTVEPLAARVGTRIRARPELAEGTSAEAVLRLALDHRDRNPVLCAHGDVIPKVIRRLVADGMRTHDDNVAAKGSVWILELDDGRARRGCYVPPPI